MFDHPIFNKAPALQSLKDNQEPNGEYVRACLSELGRIITFQQEQIEELQRHIRELRDTVKIKVDDPHKMVN